MKKNFPKKRSHNAEKTERGDSLVSPGIVCYAEKEKLLLVQFAMIQFGTIKFCRTFKNYFGQFVWIEKRVTIIVAFHFMERRLKIKSHSAKNGSLNLILKRVPKKQGPT